MWKNSESLCSFSAYVSSFFFRGWFSVNRKVGQDAGYIISLSLSTLCGWILSYLQFLILFFHHETFCVMIWLGFVSEFQAGWAGFLGYRGGVWLLPVVTPVHHLLSSRTILKEQQEHQSSSLFYHSCGNQAGNSLRVLKQRILCALMLSPHFSHVLPETLSDYLA